MKVTVLSRAAGEQEPGAAAQSCTGHPFLAVTCKILLDVEVAQYSNAPICNLRIGGSFVALLVHCLLISLFLRLINSYMVFHISTPKPHPQFAEHFIQHSFCGNLSS